MSDEIWYPNGTKRVGVDVAKRVLINIIAEAGVGKSHLVAQLAADPDYGPDEILVFMTEDATATYDAPVNIVRVEGFDQVAETLDQVIAAHKEGRRVPKVVIWDSVSGSGDWQMEGYSRSPITSRGGARDKIAEYGDLLEQARIMFLNIRDRLPCDVVNMITCWTNPKTSKVELCIPGAAVPANLTRWSGVTLHMKAEEIKYDPAVDKPKPAAHRTIGCDETGKPLGVLINRYFYTMNSGEIQAKGHHNLALRERAILPDILRRIHGGSK